MIEFFCSHEKYSNDHTSGKENQFQRQTDLRAKRAC